MCSTLDTAISHKSMSEKVYCVSLCLFFVQQSKAGLSSDLIKFQTTYDTFKFELLAYKYVVNTLSFVDIVRVEK